MNTVNVAEILASREGTYQLQAAIKKNTYRSFVYAMAFLCLFGIATTLLMRKTVADTFVYHLPVIETIGITIPNNQPIAPVETKQVTKAPIVKSVSTVIPDIIGSVVPKDNTQTQQTTNTGTTGNNPNTNSGLTGAQTQTTDKPQQTTTGTQQQQSGSVVYGDDPELFPEVEPQLDFASFQKAVVYPDILRNINKEGTVLLAVLVGTDGKIMKINVEQSDHNMFTESAIRAVKTQTFAPARQNNQAVPCWIRIPVTFKLR
ncbi:MAG: energy transducer TonB [Bacteriodetes bacterium]|nr:energy transducer TonB [Bacteroidota bacterium]